ncbi:Ras- protein Rab-5A, variant 2 [Schistosoma haematobium]|uniref:Ras- protein Rab-5A, variant 2 n=2 Tax=Schistosoma TaxID=6181 RepID=A0A922S7D7_SCHHA|nr:Ras- protein Rab-5A, variant 2 [Schistosoma haematobium]KAH9596615.1 Ras- protein Rab-5A, variant 2 [Schistosoma haematobium]CAH8479139.1 unnamed protein product [Schistosoma mattheei]
MANRSSHKLVILGESAVGKSSIVLRLVKCQFRQERYHSLAPMYYRGAQAAVVVYDITNQNSFERAKSWVNELQEKANTSGVIALAGNKVDLEGQRAVSFEEAQEYADKNRLLFMETSAKIATNVSELFTAIARELLNHTEPSRPSGGQQLTPNDSPTQQRQCCR